MRKHLLQLAVLIAVLVQAVPQSPLAGATYWWPYGGKLAAFSLDLQTLEATLVSQAVGTSATYIYAAATEPGSGEVWVSYWDYAAQEETLGIWAPGDASPTAVATFSDLYLYDIEFSPTGALYAHGYDYANGSYILGTVNLTTGAVTTVVAYPYDEYGQGLAFHPIDGKLYFSATNNGSGTSIDYVDTLTIPAHQRSRVWDDSAETDTVYVYDQLFDSAASLVLVAYKSGSGGGTAYRRPTPGLPRVGSNLTVVTPLTRFSFSTSRFSPAAGALGCIPTPTQACLQNRRFLVEATYDATIFGGAAGTATPNVESDQSLKFSFFDPTNLELFLKVIDGCSYNGHYWVFVSGLTNAGVALQLTDKVTNAVYTYNNPAGQAFAPSLDIEAFACN